MRRLVPTILLVAIAAGACSPAVDQGSSPVPSPVGSLEAVAATPVPPSPSPVAAARPSPAANPTASPPAAPPASPGPVSTPSPTADATAAPDASPEVRPAPRTSVSLARTADFVRQYTFEWCVGASIQMTRSIVTGTREESRATQRRYWEMARARTIGSPYGGANPAGWTAALNDLDVGRYRLVSIPTFEEAVMTAARALADTGRPVGLVMWAGRHAWVMTGYEATGDLADPAAKVRRVRVMDPLYPHGSRWGPSPEPNSLVGMKALRKQFVLRNRPDYDFGMAPGWLLVLPVG